MTMFFLGASCVVLLTQGFNITTSLANTIQYMGKIILTDNGSNQNAITGIVLDGSNGDASFNGDVSVGTDLTVNGSGSFSQFLSVVKGVFFGDTLTISKDLSVGGSGSISGNLDVTKDFSLHGSGAVLGNLDVTKDLSVHGSGLINGNIVAKNIDAQGHLYGLYNLFLNNNVGGNESARLNVDGVTHDSSLSLRNGPGFLFSINHTNSSGIIFNTDEAQPMIFSIIGNEAMRINSNGNIGIGTGIPSQRLEVNGNIKLSTGGWIGATGTNQLFLGTNENVGIGTGSPSQKLEVNGNIKLSQPGWIGTTADQIAFGSNGNIGIGGSTDSNRLRVHGALYADSFKNNQLTIGSNNITMTPVDGGTYGYKMKIIGSNNNYGSAYESCSIETPDCLNGGDIVIIPGNSHAVLDNGNIFLGFDNGSAVGKVGIGTGISSDTRLNVGGSMRVYGSGTFTSAVTAQAFLYSSDRRYKDNITLITDPLQKILGLNGYTFTWKDTGRADIGVIAQEVEQVFPQAVSTNADGYKSVEYGNLVAPIIEAVKALYYKYLDQEARIEKMEQEISLLKNTID